MKIKFVNSLSVKDMAHWKSFYFLPVFAFVKNYKNWAIFLGWFNLWIFIYMNDKENG